MPGSLSHLRLRVWIAHVRIPADALDRDGNQAGQHEHAADPLVQLNGLRVPVRLSQHWAT